MQWPPAKEGFCSEVTYVHGDRMYGSTLFLTCFDNPNAEKDSGLSEPGTVPDPCLRLSRSKISLATTRDIERVYRGNRDGWDHLRSMTPYLGIDKYKFRGIRMKVRLCGQLAAQKVEGKERGRRKGGGFWNI